MAQYLNLPNGYSIEIPQGMSPETALAKAQQQYPEVFGGAPAQPQRTGIGAALSKGLEGLVSSGRTGIESLLGSPEEAAKRGLERGQAMAEKYPDQVSMDRVREAYEKNGVLSAAGEALSQSPAALAEQAPNIAATMASARAGQQIGKFFGPAGRVIGAGIGAAAPGLAQMFGSNIERQAAEQEKAGKPVEIDRAAAAAAAVPQAALDVAAQFIPLGGRLVSKLTGVPEKALVGRSAAQVQKLADEKLYTTLAKGLGTGLLAEIPTEVAQQMLERAQAGLSLTSPDALKEYGETAYQVGLLAPIGGAGRVAERAGARSELQQKQEDEMAAERSKQQEAEEQRIADLKAREGTPEYALEVRDQLNEILAKRAELDKVANGKTEEGDLLGEQAKRDARAERKKLLNDDETKRLISEYSKLKATGIYEQIEEKERVAKLTPEEYALEDVEAARANAPAARKRGAWRTEESDFAPAPTLTREERRQSEQEQFELGKIADLRSYAQDRMGLANEQLTLPNAQEFADYLAQDPAKAVVLLQKRVTLPGLTAKQSAEVYKALRENAAVKAYLDEQAAGTAQRTADLKAQVTTEDIDNTLANEYLDQLDIAAADRSEGRTRRDIEDVERLAKMPTQTTTQGELFGGEAQRVNMPLRGTPADIDAQLAELRRQLDVAKSYGAPDTVSRRSNRERISDILQQIRDLEERKAKIETGAPMGQESTAALGEAFGIQLPENERAQREAAAARDAAARDVILNRQQDRREAVIGNLLKEIQAVRGRLKPETITQISNDADAILDKPEDSEAALRALDELSARWRAGVRRGTYGATEAVPTQTSAEMLQEQMDRAFAANDMSTRTERRERYAPQDMALLNQIADNFKAFVASPDRRNLAGAWLHRVTTTGRSNPEMTRDLQEALRTLEEGKRSETERGRTAVQGELEVGEKGTIFATPEELDQYLASDYLQAARENQGLARETVSRLGKQVKEYESQMADLQKQIDALAERKEALKEVQVSERRTADNIIADAESQLSTLLEQLADELGPIRMSLEQAEINLAEAEARSEETSRLIANNIANFTAMDDKVVAAAQATVEAKAELRKARNKLGSLEEKRPGIDAAQRKVIAALQRQRNPLLFEMQEKMQDLQAQLEKARKLQPRTAERLENEIAELEDLMDMQRDNPYVPSSAMVTFLNNDLQLQMDAMQDRAKIGAAKRSVQHFTKKLAKASDDLKVDISTHPEVKALREQISAAKELGADALRGVEGEIALLDDEMAKLQNAQKAEQRKADTIENQIIEASESRSFAAQLAGTAPETLSAIDRAETAAKDKQKLEDFQARAERLNALPGQRIDFSKRQEMLELVNASDKDFDDLNASIKDMEEGIDELQVRDHLMHEEMLDLQDQAKSFRGPRKHSKAGKEHAAKVAALQKKIDDNTARIQSLRSAITQYEKTIATKQAALVKAQLATSSDPEIYKAVTEAIDKRMAKLEKTIAGKEAAVVKGDADILKMARDIKAKADEGKTAPEKLAKMRQRLKVLKASQADRVKHLKEYVKEREVLQARRSNRLGITRTDVLTGQRVAGEKAKKGSITEQEQFDAELDRVQELGRANDRMEELKKGLDALQKAKEPKTDAKKTERAERIAKMQADINKQQELIDSLTPKAVGAVSQATKIESSAPGKFRAGTEQTKSETGTVRRPIIESRAVAQPTAKQAVADANTFAARLRAAKTPAALDAEFAAKDIETQNQIIEAVESNIARLRTNADNIASELFDLNQIPANETTTAHGERKDELRRQLASTEQMLDGYMRDQERLLAVQEAAETGTEVEETAGTPSGFTSVIGIEETPLSDVVFRTDTQGGAGSDPDSVKALAARLTKDWVNAPEIVVVASERQLPVRILNQVERDKMWGRVPGLYDSKTKKVYLVASNLHSASEVLATIAHEATGHFGLQTVLGDNYARTMNDIYRGNAAVRAVADQRMKDSPNLSLETAVEEALAEQAERDPDAPDTRTAMRKIFDAIKNFFKNVLGFKDTVSDEAVRQILANARKYVIEGGEAGQGLAQVDGLNYRTGAPKYASNELARAGAVADKTIAQQRGFMATIKEEGAGLKLVTNMVDRFAPLEKLSKYMPSLKGLQMMYYLRMYDQRMNFVAQSVGTGALRRVEKTRADGKKEFVIESAPGASLKGVVTILKDGNSLVGSAEGNSRLFSMYLVAKRAERVGLTTLNYGGKVTEQDLRDVRHAVATTPGLKDIYDRAQREYNQYNRDMLQFAVDTGALSAKARDELIKHGDYVPYYRERNGGVEMMLGGQAIAQIGSVKEQPYLHELVGGSEPILDFMTSAVQNTNMLADMSLRNLATKNAVFELQELGMATIGKGNAASGPNVVKFKVDGVDKFAMLDTEDIVVGGKKYSTGIPADLVVKGMEGVPVQNTIITKLMGGPARVLRKFVVLNPLYAARQLFRDSLAAPMLSGADFTPIIGALKTIGTDTGKTLERRGITGGQVFTGTQEDLTAILRQISSGESSWAQGISKLEAMSMEADALTRRAQYNSYIKQGLSEMEATYMALESMNFSKRGSNPAMHTLSTVIPFFNAQVQSLNVLFKAFSGNMPFNEKLKIREKLYQRGLMLAAMTMTYAALMQDDEAYKNATPEQKYGNWFVKLPGMEESLRIPIPFEMGYIFKAIPEAIVNSMMSQRGGEEAAQAFKQIALQIVPGGSSYGVPQAMKPLLEAGLGKSFYTGRDLESAHEKTLEPGQRARGTTTELARLVGEKLNISPIKIDHLIQGYMSTTGLALADALSFALPSPERPVEATKRLSEMRVVGSLFQPKDAGGMINATYERMKRAAEVKATYNDMLKNGRTAEAQRYIQENMQEYALASAEQSFSNYMQKIAKYEQAVRASTNMTPDEKRRALDEYRQLKIRYATYVREAVDRTAPR